MKTVKHQANMGAIKSVKPFSQEFKKKRFEVRLALHTALKSSFRSIDSLGMIINAETATNIKLHRTKAMAIVRKVLGPYFQQLLFEDLIETPFSLGVDESTDISVTKQLSVTVRYFSKKYCAIKETFLCLREIEGGDAVYLTGKVQEIMDDWKLTGPFLVGLGTDGCNAMIGKHNSLRSHMKDKYPHLQAVRCVCHSMDLAAAEFVKILPLSLIFLVRESYNFFAHSTIRQRDYKEILDLVGFADIHDPLNEEAEGKVALKLISTSKTRWLVIADCMERVLQQYSALRAFFEMAAAKDRDDMASVLSGMFKDEKNKVYFVFVLPLIKELRRLTKLFEKKTGDNFKIYKEIIAFFVSLGRRVLKPAIMNRNTLVQLCDLKLTDFCFLSMDDADIGHQFQTKVQALRISESEKLNMKKRAYESLKVLLIGLQMRLADTVQIYEDIEPFMLPNFIENEDPKPECFKSRYFNSVKVQNGMIEQIVRQLKIETVVPNETTEEFWCRCHMMTDIGGTFKYRDVTDGVIRMLCLPIANGEVERSFSGVNNTKTDERSQMKNDLLEAILHCKFGLTLMKQDLENFVPPVSMLKYDSSIYN